MSRSPKPVRHTSTEAAAAAMAADLEAPSARYVRRSDTAPPVPGRTRTPDIGAACHETRKVADKPVNTDSLRKGVDIGTPTGADSGPSAAHGTLTYEQRQARARRGR